MDDPLAGKLLASCDYLVVGGGAAGCIVARRLADIPGTTTILVEAGNSDEGDPAATDLSLLDRQDESYDWGYLAQTSSGKGTPIEYARAKMLGGCANHNDCAFIPPAPGDLDRWELMGARDWNATTLSPALERVERRIGIESSPPGTTLSRAFIDSGIALGLPETDFRENVRHGTGWFPLNAAGNLRQSSSIAYLHPIGDLPSSLEVLTRTRVRNVLIRNSTVFGAETDRGRIAVGREVILCAGSINTPHLLMLSGVGPGNELSRIGVPVISDLPGVGRNLIDHAAANICCELHNAVPTWNRTPCEATALLQLDAGAPAPEILFHFVLRMREKYPGGDRFAHVRHGVKISPNVTRPKSRGWLTLKDRDPDSPPLIELNYFSDPDGQDMRTMIAGLRFARKLAATPPLAGFIDREVEPGPAGDSELEHYVRDTCETVYHPCGTCKMGLPGDPTSVVDPRLRVHGVTGLRVADASVFPDIVTANICNTVMMVAEQASDIIIRENN